MYMELREEPKLDNPSLPIEALSVYMASGFFIKPSTRKKSSDVAILAPKKKNELDEIKQLKIKSINSNFI